MDNGEIAPPAAKRREKSPYIPHELVREIMVRLPVQSLLRFSCDCKAWGSTISGDASFHRTHLRLQKPCMLLSPFAGFNRHDDGRMRKVGFYRWEASHGTQEAPLVYATEVARFFYRSAPTTTGDYHYVVRMEVFTMGVDWQWRETEAQPPYPAMPRRVVTSFEGSLLWIIDERALGNAALGFLRFDLADETFGLTPLPPWCPSSEHATICLAELRGELLAALVCNDVEMWMCDNVDNPHWELRHKVVLSLLWTQHLDPIGVFDDDIVFQDDELLIRYDRQTKSVKGLVSMMDQCSAQC
ncbi:hypothetical protein ACQ4PT_026749 [Festuca glaucescens]